MKKILIVTHAMNIGGIEKSLLYLLKSFDYNKYEVDLFLMRKEGELLNEIPKEVNILPVIPACTCYAKSLKEVIIQRHFLMVLGRVFAKFKARIFIKRKKINKKISSVELEYSHKYTIKFLPRLKQNKVYDLAISFATPHYFVRDKVCAKKKAAWVHTDYSTIRIDYNSEILMWKAYDHIVAVSDACLQSFLNTFPTLKNKSMVIENILLPNEIEKESLKKADDKLFICSNSVINILSVGRFAKAKNFEIIPEIVANLKKRGIEVCWYLIGFGSTENDIRKKIGEFNVKNNVIILGKKDNPYPYMRNCDVYIQPSLFEGKCVAVREAQILNKPVIITNYSTAKSQVISGVNGYIISQEKEKIILELYDLLKNKNKLDQVSENCKKIDFGNVTEIRKIYDMMKE